MATCHVGTREQVSCHQFKNLMGWRKRGRGSWWFLIKGGGWSLASSSLVLSKNFVLITFLGLVIPHICLVISYLQVACLGSNSYNFVCLQGMPSFSTPSWIVLAIPPSWPSQFYFLPPPPHGLDSWLPSFPLSPQGKLWGALGSGLSISTHEEPAFHLKCIAPQRFCPLYLYLSSPCQAGGREVFISASPSNALFQIEMETGKCVWFPFLASWTRCFRNLPSEILITRKVWSVSAYLTVIRDFCLHIDHTFFYVDPWLFRYIIQLLIKLSSLIILECIKMFRFVLIFTVSVIYKNAM